jgi:hypothetical protein
MFGYAIALCGLVYYKLGAEKLKEYFADAGRAWADFGSRRPVVRKLITFGAVFTFVLLAFGALGPHYDASNYLKNSRKTFKGVVG